MTTEVTTPTTPVTPVKLGIENLWKVIEALLEAGNIAGDIAAKSANNATLAWYEKYLIPFTKLGDEVIALFSVSYNQVWPEFKDLDAEEKQEIYNRAVAKFDIPQDEVEVKIEKILEITIKLGDIVVELIDISKSFKKN